MQPKGIYKGYKVARKSLKAYSIKCSMKMYLKVIGCSCYTCLPRTAPAAAQTTQRKVAAPGTGTPPKDQRLLTIATPKQVQHIHIHANKANTKK